MFSNSSIGISVSKTSAMFPMPRPKPRSIPSKTWWANANTKNSKQILPTARKTIEEYETQVDALSENLKNKFRDEEDCRTLALEKKEKYRKVKQDYYAHQSDMSLVVSTFDLLFRISSMAISKKPIRISKTLAISMPKLLSDKVGPVVDQVGKISRSFRTSVF
jgi:hypothetical protein